ncbi:serine/threonine-protein kinase [Aggregicoccus sp. 17bor-14]|uniref:serine/threonine-protein kinase n=1 Tax=Myxococcaceae TaxID=31 RepID=UPI003519EA29
MTAECLRAKGRGRVDPPQSASLGSKSPLSPDAPLTLPSAPRQPLPFGNYLLLDRIGVGGMAEVWRATARDPSGLERLVAIKRILPSLAQDPDFLAMFQDEARLGGQLVHPHIARVHELGQCEDGSFIAMEYIPGKDLRALFERNRRNGAPMPLRLAVYALAQLADGLDFAHRQCDARGESLQVVHRDVSPQNAVVSYAGEVKLIDFGIARAAGMGPRGRSGALKGKFSYMSPEQVRGQPVDARSDVFALGVCLYELLTGERLFNGETDFVVLEQVREAQVEPPSRRNPRIPAALERIVLRALAREPEARYASAGEVAGDLRSFLAAQPPYPTRAELAAYMQATFAEEMAQEQERLEAFLAARVDPSTLPTQLEVPASRVLPLPLGEGRGEGSEPAPVHPTPTAAPLTAGPRARPASRRRALLAAASLALLAAAGAAGYRLLPREPAQGFLLVDVPPELRGLARVSVNGEDLGAPMQWPLLRRVAAGPALVQVTAPGREPFRTPVRVDPGTLPTRVDALPRAREVQVPLVVRTEPADAQLLLDGRVVREAGESREYVGALVAGTRARLEARAPGYRPLVQELAPEEGRPLQISARLESEAVAQEQIR